MSLNSQILVDIPDDKGVHIKIAGLDLLRKKYTILVYFAQLKVYHLKK
jgi:hypothetical protein